MPFIVQKIAGKQSLIDVVPGKVLRIGRGTNAELRFDDIAVALEHAVIERAGGGYRLLDRGSVTGTYLNGTPVSEAPLAHDDVINIGGYRIKVQLADPEDPLFLSVRASSARDAPTPATTVIPPSVMAAAVQAAAAQQAAAPATQPPAGEVESGDAAPAVGDKTVRMSPEALAAALRAATAMAAAARAAAAAPAAEPAPAAAAGPAGVPAAGSAPAAAPGAPETPETPETPEIGPAAAAPSGSASAPSTPPSSLLPSSPPSPAPPQLRAPAVDYLHAYSLRRTLFNKALLALVLCGASAAALLYLARTGKATSFEPGRVHLWHAETSCASCHTPWRGPDPALCSDCHAKQQREKGEIHQARQTFTPPCTGCHPEHRGGDRVSAAGDAQCVSCHGDLRVDPPGAEPRFARSVRAFVDDHPDFSVTLPGGARLPLAEAVARRADPTPLSFDHMKHLRPGLPTPAGRVQLACQDCHHLSVGARAGSPPAPGGGRTETPAAQGAAAGATTGMVPVTYETSCTTSGCHRLTFDNRRPSQVAPHASTQRVREFLISVYSDRRGTSESVGDQYRSLIRGAGAPPRGIDYSSQAQGAVVLAERYLYGTACKECHLVDLKASPPKVTWTPIPARWLPNGRFQHLDHPTDCQLCHAAAAASTVAADVLLPSIAVCRTCHGGASGAAQVKIGAAPAAPTNCLSCHQYHPDSPNQAPGDKPEDLTPNRS